MKAILNESRRGAWWAICAVGVVLSIGSFFLGVDSDKRHAEYALRDAEQARARADHDLMLLERRTQAKDEKIKKLMEELDALTDLSSGQASTREQKLEEQVRLLTTAIDDRDARVIELSSKISHLESVSTDVIQKTRATPQIESDRSHNQANSAERNQEPPAIVQPSFEAKQFRANTIGTRLADNRKEVRVIIEIENITANTLYLAYDGYREPFASTEGADKFDRISIVGLERLISGRADTYEQKMNYTAIPAGNRIRTIWEVPMKHGEPPIQGKSLTLRANFLWLSDLGLKRISFQMSDIQY